MNQDTEVELEQQDGADDVVTVEDNGNTLETPEEIAAAEAARTAALRQVAADGDDADGKPGKGQFIPKGRFDEVNTRKNALELENAQLLALLAAGGKTATAAPAPAPAPAADEFDVKKAIREKIAALNVGDDDKALELEEQINAHNIKVARAQAREEFEAGQNERTAQQEANALKAAATEIKKAYPQLDEAGEEADEDAIAFVIAKRDALVGKGMGLSAALREAAKVAAKRFGFDAPALDPNAPTKLTAAEERLAAARTRNADAANRQPPALGGKGDRATQTARADVEKMTDEEFAALPEAEKKRLRGDM